MLHKHHLMAVYETKYIKSFLEKVQSPLMTSYQACNLKYKNIHSR